MLKSDAHFNDSFGVYPESVQEFLRNFKQRHRVDDIIVNLRSLKNLRALVIGETIIDEYHSVTNLGKPLKGNHLSARFVSEETYAGGILACANHMADFCGEIDLVTAMGKDDPKEKFVRSRLRPGINLYLSYTSSPTIVKRRFVDEAFKGKMFEVYYMDDRVLDDLEAEIKKTISDLLSKNNYDLVLVLDYGHGLMTKSLIYLLCAQSKFLAVNAQTNSASIGYNLITKYPHASFYCLDDHEIRLAYQDKHGDILRLSRRLAEQVKIPGGIALTLGHKGALTYDAKNHQFFETPTFSYKVVDTLGAGDAFISVASPCVAAGFPMDLVGFIGNAVGAIKVGIIGNKSSVEADSLYQFINALLK